MEYKCDMCGAPATVHITKIVNGQKIKMHLCQSCAEKNADLSSAGFPADIFPKIKKLEEQILKAVPVQPEGGATAVCPRCGTPFSEFEKRGRFSCPECYSAFGGKVRGLLSQMHGAVRHTGKVPRRFASAAKAVAGDDRQIEIPLDLSASSLSAEIPSGQDAPVQAPPPPQETVEELKERLAEAVRDERYEDAAVIRDRINSMDNPEK